MREMAKHHWTVLTLVFASCVGQILSLVYIHARADPHSTATPPQYINVSFTLDIYARFHQCLSDQAYNRCRVQYDESSNWGVPKNVNDIFKELPNNIRNETSTIFQCENQRVTHSFHCNRQIGNSLLDLCSSSKNYQFFLFNNSICIAFVWLHKDEYLDSQVAAVEICDGCSETTTSTTSPAETTTVTSATSSIAAAIITSTSTSTGSTPATTDKPKTDPEPLPGEQGDNTGMIAGIVIGVIIALCIIVVAVYLYIRTRFKVDQTDSDTKGDKPQDETSESVTSGNQSSGVQVSYAPSINNSQIDLAEPDNRDTTPHEETNEPEISARLRTALFYLQYPEDLN